MRAGAHKPTIGLAAGAAAGALLLLVALFFDARALGLSLFLGGATYVGFLAVDHPGVDPAAPLVAVLLLLTGELAAWSLDERWANAHGHRHCVAPRSRAERSCPRAASLSRRSPSRLSAAPAAHGLPWTILGAIAAVAAAGRRSPSSDAEIAVLPDNAEGVAGVGLRGGKSNQKEETSCGFPCRSSPRWPCRAATTAIALAAGSGLPNIGAPKMKAEPVYRGYYDKHIDTYMLTDVSNKAQATAMHINYAAALAKIKGLPLQYFVKGRAAKGQLTVFGAEPG